MHTLESADKRMLRGRVGIPGEEARDSDIVRKV